jgi:hypothetical protein
MNPISTASGNYFVGTSTNRLPNADNDRSHGSDVSNLLRDIANLLDGGNSASSASNNGAGQDGQVNDVAKFSALRRKPLQTRLHKASRLLTPTWPICRKTSG